jgi:hypothetical protein
MASLLARAGRPGKHKTLSGLISLKIKEPQCEWCPGAESGVGCKKLKQLTFFCAIFDDTNEFTNRYFVHSRAKPRPLPVWTKGLATPRARRFHDSAVCEP